MAKRTKQAEAASHIGEILNQGGLDIPSRQMTLADSQQWVIFQHKSKQIGIDSAAGVWVRKSEDEDWRCIAMPCTVSGAIQAAEFLIKD
jgi:hypothetical protein